MHDGVKWIGVPRHGRLPPLQQAQAVSSQHNGVLEHKDSTNTASQALLDTCIGTGLPACDAH